MTPSRPSRLATWLLRRFGCSDSNDAVMGDLAERYSKGQTRIWYWRQVIVSIVISAFNDIRGHKLLTVRDLVLGWVVLWASGGAVSRFLEVFTYEWLPATHFLVDQFLRNRFPTVHTWIPLRVYSDFEELYPSALGILIGLLIPLLSGIITGWIVSKVHHPHDRSLLLLLNATLLLFWLIEMRSEVDSTGVGLWAFGASWMLLISGVFIGGLLKRGQKLQTEAA